MNKLLRIRTWQNYYYNISLNKLTCFSFNFYGHTINFCYGDKHDTDRIPLGLHDDVLRVSKKSLEELNKSLCKFFCDSKNEVMIIDCFKYQWGYVPYEKDSG